MKDRITKLIASENVNPAGFAEILGVQRSAISHILTERNKPSYDLIHKILTKFPRISAEWLIMGQGGMYKAAIQKTLFDVADQNANNPLPNPVSPVTNQISNEIIKNHIDPNDNSKLIKSDLSEKEIDKVIVIFKDNTFKAYNPST